MSGRVSDESQVDALVDAAYNALAGRTIAALTGAGISTDSGIPDYRGEGSVRRTPMSIEQFLSSTRAQQRYWAGSHLGWSRFAAANPNAGHLALVELESKGILSGVITQNVDGLHTRAGSRRVVTLHGSMSEVRCLACGQFFARSDIARIIDQANPQLQRPESITIAPDGDAEVTRVEDFVLPVCSVCGGPLKPDVVFFGEFVPPNRFAEAQAMLASSQALLVVGSSLVVNTGVRLVAQARRQRIPVVIVNRGATKSDGNATVKIDAGTSEVLQALAARLGSVQQEQALEEAS